MSKQQISELEEKEAEEIAQILTNFSKEDKSKIYYVTVGYNLAVEKKKKKKKPKKVG